MTEETAMLPHEGLGELLKQAIEIADERAKPEVKSIELERGEKALVALGHDGETTTLEVLNPKDFDGWRSRPLNREGAPVLTSLDSLIDYVDRFKDESSAVFASDNRESPKIVAVLDYHESGGAYANGQRFGRHSATFPVPLSDEWVGWNGCDGKVLEMRDFARFLEDHIVDVMDPNEAVFSTEQAKFVNTLGGPGRMATPAKLMELATGLQVFEQGQVSQAVKLATGEAQITIESEHRDAQGNQLVVPSMFVIAIPVFRSGEPYQIVARLRYRKGGSGILFFYELWRADKVFDHAFNEACERIESETSLPVYRGIR